MSLGLSAYASGKVSHSARIDHGTGDIGLLKLRDQKRFVTATGFHDEHHIRSIFPLLAKRIDRNGVVSTVIEGPFSVAELERAVAKVAGG